jgi:SPP1 gp7 family putative phage head morphogenesis protein
MPHLTPFNFQEKYYAGIEKEVQRLLNDIIYIPLIRALRRSVASELHNAITGLLGAARRGSVWYADGYFSGQFNAKLSAELRDLGAKFTPSKGWKLPFEKVPPDFLTAMAEAQADAEDARQAILITLDGIDPESVAALSDTRERYEHTVNVMEGDFQIAAEAIAIVPKLTEKARQIIAKQWGANLDLYIQNWAAESILSLRQEVQSHVLSGGRARGLEKLIEESYGASRHKAKFLARQETSLLMSKFQEQRYADIGVRRYRWSDSGDVRVRHDHHLLNGKIFSFSSPPVTNRETGARNNPGEDFGCRCKAVAVFD